jgi:hypothetical protein
VRSIEILLRAWHAIRRNGETSRSRKTREETKAFGAELPREIRRLQERLRKTPYQFARQFGAMPEKAKGKGKRPLVVAPISDRIVQRAILEVLQDATELAGVQDVLATPTSIGGIRGRGVERAIELIEMTYLNQSANFIAGSDISGFFTVIKQSDVVQFVQQQTDDAEFVDLLARAMRVDLANANDMTPDELRMFPTDDVGVAQGCPLSAFAGNVALRQFDRDMNGNGITCIRYIDDFILLGAKRTRVEKAFQSAEKRLKDLGMSIYQPNDRPDKAFFGEIKSNREFLGYVIKPGTYPPSSKNTQHILDSVRDELNLGRAHILRALSSGSVGKPMQYYSQALVSTDQILRAWSGSFGASRCIETAKHIDNEINGLVSDFIAFYRDQTKTASQLEKRRVLGVHVLADDVLSRLKKPIIKQ